MFLHVVGIAASWALFCWCHSQEWVEASTISRFGRGSPCAITFMGGNNHQPEKNPFQWIVWHKMCIEYGESNVQNGRVRLHWQGMAWPERLFMVNKCAHGIDQSVLSYGEFKYAWTAWFWKHATELVNQICTWYDLHDLQHAQILKFAISRNLLGVTSECMPIRIPALSLNAFQLLLITSDSFTSKNKTVA